METIVKKKVRRAVVNQDSVSVVGKKVDVLAKSVELYLEHDKKAHVRIDKAFDDLLSGKLNRGQRGERGESGRTRDLVRFWDTYPSLTVWVLITVLTLVGIAGTTWVSSLYSQIKINTGVLAADRVEFSTLHNNIDTLKSEDVMHRAWIDDLKSDIKIIQSDVKELLRRSR